MQCEGDGSLNPGIDPPVSYFAWLIRQHTGSLLMYVYPFYFDIFIKKRGGDKSWGKMAGVGEKVSETRKHRRTKTVRAVREAVTYTQHPVKSLREKCSAE